MRSFILAAVTAFFLTACLWPASKQARTRPDAPPVRLQWISTEYFQAGQGDPVVEVRIILDNRGVHTTDSTTILWEPSFQQRFTFLRSDPPAWRTRVDERGRGVVDTSGTIPGRYSTFSLWFVANPDLVAGGQIVQEPEVVVVANGDYVVADTIATATHLKSPAAIAGQQTFERGALAATADLARFVPADRRGALAPATLMSAAVSLVLAAGSVAAYRSVARRR